MTRTGRAGAAVLVGVALVVAACTTWAASAGAAVATKAPKYERTIRLAVADLQDYWAEQLPDLYGVRYQRIADSKIIPHTSTSKLPRCGTGRVRYKDVEGNAFYCNAGKFVAYDDEQLFPQLAEQFGDFTIVVTLAHEWGHAVQDQAGLSGPTLALEQQAGCFAGAWVRHVADGDSKRLTLEEGNLDTGLAGFLTFRDPPGSDPTAAGAHGSAFDRVGAFQEGFDQGPERCGDFERHPPELTEIPFADANDRDRGGDLPYRQVLPLSAEDLDVYWSSLIDDYRPVADIRSYDSARTRPTCRGQKLASRATRRPSSSSRAASRARGPATSSGAVTTPRTVA
jgi:predicted metalloprotease